MAPHRRHIGASRRKRVEEDGEDESSLAGDIEEDSLSEASLDSHQEEEDADVEGSESDMASTTTGATGAEQLNGGKTNGQTTRHTSKPPTKPGLKATVSDTEAILNGIHISDRSEGVDFNQADHPRELQTGRTPSAPPTEPKREAQTTRKRREHDKSTKERTQNPTFVPTRGDFFLHDKRGTETGSNNQRSSNKGKSRPYGLIVDSNTRKSFSKGDASGGQWAHDLHETVAGDDRRAPTQPAPLPLPQSAVSVPTAPRSSPPNRSFSSTTLVGNVPVVVFLPGMEQPKSFAAVPKKQHTRLPQHRPPLRRDKPVRISLPNQPPRYIFPSMERSFIFIPRAMRPNQGWRNRSRGGNNTLYGARRPSWFSPVYPPSLPHSRRTSLAMSSQDGYPSPTMPGFPRPMIIPSDANKPIVRLPPQRPVFPGPGMAMCPPGAIPMPPPVPLPHQPYRESRPTPLPMHQPRPKKTVSVADIESPDSFPFNPPQPQQEQPFHHQVPVPVSGSGPDQIAPGVPHQAPATTLSQIPERAIHAPSFQPVAYPGYYPNYNTGPMYYNGLEYSSFNGPMGPGASLPNLPPGQPHSMPYHHLPGSSGEQASQPGMVESGGTVYFYSPDQMYSNQNYGVPGAGPGGVVGVGGMMTPPGPGYYYSQPQGPAGAYYAPQ